MVAQVLEMVAHATYQWDVKQMLHDAILTGVGPSVCLTCHHIREERIGTKRKCPMCKKGEMIDVVTLSRGTAYEMHDDPKKWGLVHRKAKQLLDAVAIRCWTEASDDDLDDPKLQVCPLCFKTQLFETTKEHKCNECKCYMIPCNILVRLAQA